MEARNSWVEGEHVDVLDEIKRWCNGEILKVDLQKRQVKLHYSNLTSQFDELLDFDSPRIQKQWKQGMPFKLYNRLDIYDCSDRKWREAYIYDIIGEKIKIHYRGQTTKFDEWINTRKDAVRIKEVGSYSGAEGAAKYSFRHQQELQDQEKQTRQKLSVYNVKGLLDGSGWGLRQAPSEFDMKMIDWKREEEKFAKSLYSKGYRICEIGRDGNCLFRSIAHQAYGDEDLHRVIRQKCMDYILSEKEYYKDFIIGEKESVEQYVNRKKQNGIWGDDIEIQALSEIYNRPIEIYAYSDQPMKTFHEQDGSEEPFRLSYHGQSHYNSIVSMNWNYEKVFIKSKPGDIEDEAISQSKIRMTILAPDKQQDNTTGRDQQRTIQNIRLLAQIIQRSREDFQIQSQKDIEHALKQSMQEQYGANGGKQVNIENDNYQRALSQSQLQMTEEEMLKLAMEQSLQDQKLSQKKPMNLKNINIEDALLKTVLQMSNNDQINTSELSPAVKIAIENGFSLEQAIEAYSIVGDNPDQVLNYLFDTVLKIQ